MNCDEAFEAITDPDCANSTELGWHLDLCPRCRQMREVLAPALDRLIAVSDDAFTSMSPDYGSRPESSTFLSAEAVRIAERAAARCSRATDEAESDSKCHQRSRCAAFVRYAAVALLGATISLSAMGAFIGSRSNTTPATGEQCVRNNRADVETLTPEARQAWGLSCIACHVNDAVD